MAQAQADFSEALQAQRKRLLIDATMTCIATHGLSKLTLSKIAGSVGMTAGSVNFHFASKEALLLETLRHIAEEFEQAMATAVGAASTDPGERLLAIVAASLNTKLTEVRKIAVWYAFMSEMRARADYQSICGDRDNNYFQLILDLCRRITEVAETTTAVNGEAIAYGLAGMLEQMWQEILFEGDDYDRVGAQQKCHAYLASVFPWRFADLAAANARDEIAPTQEDLVYTLPAWTYRTPEFLASEKEQIFMPSWQLVCHISDIAQIGNWVSYELLGERAFVVRGKDKVIRAFNNVCPHRAHSLVQGEQGQCSARITCPYHGWTFDLDGKRRGLAAPETFRAHDAARFGLKPIDVEIFLGFVFIRFRAEGPSVAERLTPVTPEFRHYRTEERVPRYEHHGNAFWIESVDVDWKNGVENYLEDYHFPNGHRGLTALMEPDYDREPLPHGVARLSHRMRAQPLKNWSAQRYHKLLPTHEHLPADLQRRWSYYTLFPNTCFDLFPDSMDFFQMIPVAPGKMLLRGRSYVLPDERPEIPAVHYLNDRINMRVQAEDNLLTAEVQKGLSSSGYKVGILSDKECLVKHFQDWVRERIPAARSTERC